MRKITLVARLLAALCTAVAPAGCRPNADAQFAPSEAVQKLDAKFQDEIRAYLREHCGTPQRPKMAADDEFDLQHLARGSEVYRGRCQPCHGVSGDGKGPAAKSLIPLPRDYRQGIFKFTTTPFGTRPRREDLLRTIERGVPGTSMPSFRLLSNSDREAVVDYVIALSRRGELEQALVYEVEFDERIDPERVPELIGDIREQWNSARSKTVYPITPQPVFSHAHVAAGQQAFLTKGCADCHGRDGRGQTPENFKRVDAWGELNPAADLTSGFLHGGGEPIDIYRRIYSGINGTAMPSFQNALSEEPETIWNLVAYVKYVSNQRRNGVVPPAGPIRIPQDNVPTSEARE